MSSTSPLRLKPPALPLPANTRRRLIIGVVAGICIAAAVILEAMNARSPQVLRAAPRPGVIATRDVAPSLAPDLRAPPAPAALAAPAGSATPQAAATISHLSLYGTVARGDPTTGYALLGSTQQTASLYGSGVEVAPGVILREIYTNRVVLARDGALVVLRIGGASGAQGALEASPAEDSLALATSADMLRAGAADDDRMPGIRVYPGRNRGAFAQLGLHPGDLVTAINGAPVTGPDALDLQQMLKDLGHATITVFRAGRLQQVTVQHADSADRNDEDPDSP